LVLSDVKRTGAGVRLEHKFSRTLFGQALLATSRTTGTTPGVAGNGDLPYHPKTQGALGLNYVDAGGRKASVQINRVGSFFQDTGGGGPRPRFPAKTYVDLSLAKEFSVRGELFLQVSNLFDADQIIFNDVPVGGRRVVVGYTARF
jgi:outer membrane receptor protein involved in Fe transport